MGKHLAIIQGHPDPQGNHYGHALAAAYAQSAAAAGHEVQIIDVARLEFPLLRTKEDFEHGAPPDSICQAQQTIRWAEHLLIFYPLWGGTMPALLKGFLEQVFRPNFISDRAETGKSWKRPLKGKTARIVVTMGMPAFIYRWYFGAHGLKSLERSILGFCGIGPIRESLIGMVEAEDGAKRKKWLKKMRTLGAEGR
jgi:putative NADPH-quinone reductase